MPLVVSALAGLKVLELGQLIAGPFAAKTLADFGAEVVKIEPPGAGDPLRKWRLLKNGTSVWWQVQSRNKRSLALDLRTPEGQDIVEHISEKYGSKPEQMAERADIVEQATDILEQMLDDIVALPVDNDRDRQLIAIFEENYRIVLDDRRR